MPRKAPPYFARAARQFLRGTAHTCPQAAITAGARTEAEWSALLEGARAAWWSQHNKKARRAVKARHPVQVGA